MFNFVVCAKIFKFKGNLKRNLMFNLFIPSDMLSKKSDIMLIFKRKNTRYITQYNQAEIVQTYFSKIFHL